MKWAERLGKWFWGRRAKRVYAVLLILFALFNIAVFLVLPPVARSIAARKASEALSRPVTIEKIFVNPYALSLSVKGLRIGEREGSEEFVSVKSIYVNAQLASVWKLAPVIAAVYVDDPAIHIIRTGPMTFNFSDLIKPKEPKPPSEPMQFSINDIQVRNGALVLTDTTTGTAHRLEQIRLSIPSVSNFPYFINSDVQPAFSALFDGSPIALTGQSQPFAESLQTTLDLKVTDLELPRYMGDVPIPLNFRIDSGRVTCKFHLAFTQYKEVPPALVLSGDIALADFQLSDLAGKPVVRVPEFRIDRLSIRPLKMQVYLGKILIREPELNIVRDASGKLNLLALLPTFPEKPAAEKPAEPPPPTDPAAQPPKFPVTLDLDSFNVVGAKVDISDEPPGGSFHAVLSPIDLECVNLSTAQGKSAEYKFAMRTDSDETVTASGSFSINPMAAQVHAALEGLFLPKYAPYYADKFLGEITDGRVSVTGDATAARQGESLQVGFRGRASLNKLNVLDKRGGETMVSLGALNVEGIVASFPPAALSIEEILVAQPKIQVVRNEDSSINLLATIPPPKAEDAAAPTAGAGPAPAAEQLPMPVIAIGKITVREGGFSFQDKSLTPIYRTSLDAIEASVQGFAMDPKKQDQPAEFLFHALLDNQSPIGISGKLLPNPDNLYANVRVDFQDVQLSPLTPYSDKFIGYPIDKGRLRLDLQYLVQGVKLDSQNRILLDQLTLGDRVDSPTATKLPVKFAIALLKDRHGQIKLDVPVSGSLDDPKFRVLPIVLQTLVNLITRAVTSPFAFLTGSEEASYIEFDYGSAVLSPEAIKSLNSIAEALADRPALRFEVRTETLAGPDTESLRRQFLADILKAEKRRKTMGKAGANTPLSEIQVAPEEYEQYLKEVYKSADIPDKPTGFLGAAKDVPVADMEEALLENIKVTPDDLRLLAYQRAASVKEYLLNAKATDAEHILLTEPRQATAEGGEEVRPRAEFTLQMADAGPGAAFAPPPAGGEPRDLPRKSSLGRTILYVVGGAIVIGAAFAL